MSEPSSSRSDREEIREEVRRISREAGRSPEDVRIVAVTKGFPAPLIESARASGFSRIGESYVQESLDKKEQLPADVRGAIEWHFIGHLQSNKVRKILGEFELIHSVDRSSLIEEFHKRLRRKESTQKVLMQVNVSGEESKFGVPPEQAHSLMESLVEKETFNLLGLMTMAPLTDDMERVRSVFARCRQLRDELEESFDHGLPELSMGMTNDYPQAIREGATLLRLGRRLFGERPEDDE